MAQQWNGTGVSRLEWAVEHLRPFLADKPRSAAEVQGLAEAKGIHRRTMHRAREILGVEVVREKRTLYWHLPGDTRSRVVEDVREAVESMRAVDERKASEARERSYAQRLQELRGHR